MLKKRIILALMMIFCLIVTTQAYAYAAECMFNGVDVKTGMLAETIDGRMMATLQYTADKLGATYEVNKKRKQVTIKYDGKTFVVRAGDNNIKVDERKSWLDYPAVWKNEQLYATPYVFKRIFGVHVDANERKNLFSVVADKEKVPSSNNTQTFTSTGTLSRTSGQVIRVDYAKTEDKDVVKINLNKEMPITSMIRLSNPERLVIDFKGATLSKAIDSDIYVSGQFVKKIRTGQFNANTARVVVDMNRNVYYKVRPARESDSYEIELTSKAPEGYYNVEIKNTNTPINYVKGNMGGITGKKIAVDPGHGGHDAGAIGPNKKLEKDNNLAVGMELADLLQNAGAEVIMTRDGDYFIDLVPRATMANNWGADFFVSVHTNSAPSSGARGIETYSFSKATDRYGADLARCVQKRLVSELGLTDRGIKTANFSVLRNSNMPGILVEMGFISNPTEEAFLADPTNRKRIAQAIFDGLCDYCGQPTVNNDD